MAAPASGEPPGRGRSTDVVVDLSGGTESLLFLEVDETFLGRSFAHDSRPPGIT